MGIIPAIILGYLVISVFANHILRVYKYMNEK